MFCRFGRGTLFEACKYQWQVPHITLNVFRMTEGNVNVLNPVFLLLTISGIFFTTVSMGSCLLSVTVNGVKCYCSHPPSALIYAVPDPIHFIFRLYWLWLHMRKFILKWTVANTGVLQHSWLDIFSKCNSMNLHYLLKLIFRHTTDITLLSCIFSYFVKYSAYKEGLKWIL